MNGAWLGWHAFRRDFGTRLNERASVTKDSTDTPTRLLIYDAGLLHFTESRTGGSRSRETRQDAANEIWYQSLEGS